LYLIKKHKISAAIIGCYLLFWAIVMVHYIGFMCSPKDPYCDFTPLFVIPLSAFTGLAYVISITVKSFFRDNFEWKEYMIFTAIIYLPIIFGWIFFILKK